MIDKIKETDRRVFTLFCFRILMWITALCANIYWIYWHFHLYAMEIFDVHEYAALFRFRFYNALIVAFIAIIISFILRAISDSIKKTLEFDKLHNSDTEKTE